MQSLLDVIINNGYFFNYLKDKVTEADRYTWVFLRQIGAEKGSSIRLYTPQRGHHTLGWVGASLSPTRAAGAQGYCTGPHIFFFFILTLVLYLQHRK